VILCTFHHLAERIVRSVQPDAIPLVISSKNGMNEGEKLNQNITKKESCYGETLMGGRVWKMNF